MVFFITKTRQDYLPSQPAPAGTDEPADGEEGGDDVEDEHPKGHNEDGHVELVGDAGTLEVDPVHVAVDSLNIGGTFRCLVTS